MSQPGTEQGACQARDLLLPGAGSRVGQIDLGRRDIDHRVHEVVFWS
jgi:hypothetical protein